jgi:hypothetical protein
MAMRGLFRPVPALTPTAPNSNDRASGGYDLRTLLRMVHSANTQANSWRRRADICNAYYDGKQLSREQIQFAKDEGMEPRSTNLIARVINSVTGTEVRSRSEPRLNCDSGAYSDAGDVLNVLMKEAHRDSQFATAMSAAYASMVKGGIGWVETSINPNPLGYRYRVQHHHRNEMYWDLQARDSLYADRRWTLRSRWYDVDYLCAAMPEHRKVLEAMTSNWQGFMGAFLGPDIEASLGNMRAFDEFRAAGTMSSQWFDGSRRRVRMYELWYTVPAWVDILRVTPTEVIIFDPKNKLHQIAETKGIAKLETILTQQYRRSYFAGYYRLEDIGTNRRRSPYTPFIAFTDDVDFTPYGLIEGMISPQDEYNERRLKMQWLLKSRQIIADSDALDEKYNDFADLADEAQRPDMNLILNPNRINKNAGAVRIESNMALQREQYEAMQDARALIQDIPGWNGPNMGVASGGVTANSAMQTLVDEGMSAMGLMNSNYRDSRQECLSGLLDLIVEDHATANLKMMIGEGSSARVVVLNTFGPDGMPQNMVAEAPVVVGMSDVPSSPAARAQMQNNVAEVIKSLGGMPQAVAVLVPAFIENSALDANVRKQAVEDFRRVMNLPPAGSTMERKAAQQAAAQAQAAQAQLQGAMAQGKVDELHAKTASLVSLAELNTAKAKQLGAPDPAAANDPKMQSIQDAITQAGGQQQPSDQSQPQQAVQGAAA